MSDRKQFIVLITAITLLGALFRLYGILDQPPLDDEIHMAYTAEGYVARGHFIPSMPHHPNLRNLLVALSTEMFGINGFGLRFFSVLFGTLSIPVIGLLVHKLSADVTASALASFLLAADPLHITFSRQPIQEVHVAFFSMLGIYLVLEGLDRLDARGPLKVQGLILLPLAGIAFGLGIASKYNTAFILLVGLAVSVYRLVQRGRPQLAILAVFCLTLLPAAVFLLTDAPWFGRGYGLDDWLFMRTANLERMTNKFLPSAIEMNPDTSAWMWFIKPFLGYASFVSIEGRSYVTVGMGNPLSWLPVLPSILYLLWEPARRKKHVFLLSLFWIAYLPFIFIRRPIFAISAVAVVPYAFGLLALALTNILSTRRKTLLIYASIVLVVSISLLPLCMGKALDHRYTELLVSRFNPH
jgi:dolichyl-phosphate-mannose--protein O-mannosyl transferase